MMNNTPKGSNTYREQQILTASPAKLVAMLYEAAMTSLRRAIKAIEEGDIVARYEANAKAVEIIEHLSMTLDSDNGGDIAADLERLYPFMILHLINVDVHNDPTPAREVIALLEPLYDSWRELDRQMAQGILQPAAAPVATPEIPETAESKIEEQADGRLVATA